MKSYHVLIFIACVMACLGALCWVLPKRVVLCDHVVKWPTFAEVMGTEETAMERDTIAITEVEIAEETTHTTQTPTDKKEGTKAIDIPDVPLSSGDHHSHLSAFYQSLAHTSQRRVRVVHYGDSQIEEDRMSSQIREVLQERFGGTGVGLMPLAQTIPSRSVKQTLLMNGKIISPQILYRNIVYGPKRMQREDGLYGVMGQVAFMNDSLVAGSEQLTAICTPIDKRPRYTQVKLFADTSITYEQIGDTLHLQGKGAVYGISQESSTGIIVDNIPMRGCLGLVFNKIDSTQLTHFYRNENVTLIIMQFGGNAIPFNEKPSTIQSIVRGLRQQVRYVQSCAPHASILFIGPSDMLTTIDGVEQSYPMVSYMDRLLNKMAQEEHIAYFSLFQWMGGNGSMARWKEIGLAGSDGIHFMRSGARKAGNAVAEWILEGLTNEGVKELRDEGVKELRDEGVKEGVE